jgi:plastocyanin
MTRIGMSVAALLVTASLSMATQVPVSILSSSFSPATVQVAPGDSVVWTNNSALTHTTTSGTNGTPDGLWDSGDMGNGVTFIREFPTTGSFPYYCKYHYPMGMVGTVTVGSGGVNEKSGRPGSVTGITSFPNPFSATTTIRLAPSGVSRGNLMVFDASGKLVRTLALTRGNSTAWDGRDSRGQETEPGVYFCRYGSGTLAVTRLR